MPVPDYHWTANQVGNCQLSSLEHAAAEECKAGSQYLRGILNYHSCCLWWQRKVASWECWVGSQVGWVGKSRRHHGFGGMSDQARVGGGSGRQIIPLLSLLFFRCHFWLSMELSMALLWSHLRWYCLLHAQSAAPTIGTVHSRPA